MNVAAILKGKGRFVLTAPPDMAVSDVVNLIVARKVGSIVIVDGDRRLHGILSERDVVRLLASGGPSSLGSPIETVMTRDVVTCREGDTIDELMALMTSRRIRHLPVVEDGALVGIVSIGDVVKQRIAEVEMEAAAMREYIATG
ncbi:MAG: CBS domain-containing protein [Hyphomicrobiaceae bacterium]|nr:CBS domain-containing protein [Hyphomicrobiaceae bacterium]